MHSLTLIALLILSAEGTHWPAFRGDGTSCTAAANLPLTWSETENLAWRAKLAGRGQSSPIVQGNLAIATSVAGENKDRLFVEAFDLNTGQRAWQREFAGTQKVPDSNYVSRGAPTPAASAERIYAFFESGDLLALDHSGNTLWQRSLVDEYGPFQGNHGLGSSLALAGDTVLVLVDHDGPSYLLAIDGATGKNLWKQDRPKRVSWSSPIVSRRGDQTEVLVSSGGVAQAFDLADGRLLWQFEGIEGNTVPSATPTDELVVIGSSEPGWNFALKRDGRGQLDASAIAWRTDEASSSFGSPLVYQGHVYLVNRAGAAFCLDMATGEKQWTMRLPDSCWCSPLGAAGRVYFFTKRGITLVARAGDQNETLAENTLSMDDQDIVYGVAAFPGGFIVRTDGQLTRIGHP